MKQTHYPNYNSPIIRIKTIPLSELMNMNQPNGEPFYPKLLYARLTEKKNSSQMTCDKPTFILPISDTRYPIPIPELFTDIRETTFFFSLYRSQQQAPRMTLQQPLIHDSTDVGKCHRRHCPLPGTTEGRRRRGAGQEVREGGAAPTWLPRLMALRNSRVGTMGV